MARNLRRERGQSLPEIALWLAGLTAVMAVVSYVVISKPFQSGTRQLSAAQQAYVKAVAMQQETSAYVSAVATQQAQPPADAPSRAADELAQPATPKRLTSSTSPTAPQPSPQAQPPASVAQPQPPLSQGQPQQPSPSQSLPPPPPSRQPQSTPTQPPPPPAPTEPPSLPPTPDLGGQSAIGACIGYLARWQLTGRAQCQQFASGALPSGGAAPCIAQLLAGAANGSALCLVPGINPQYGWVDTNLRDCFAFLSNQEYSDTVFREEVQCRVFYDRDGVYT